MGTKKRMWKSDPMIYEAFLHACTTERGITELAIHSEENVTEMSSYHYVTVARAKGRNFAEAARRLCKAVRTSSRFGWARLLFDENDDALHSQILPCLRWTAKAPPNLERR